MCGPNQSPERADGTGRSCRITRKIFHSIPRKCTIEPPPLPRPYPGAIYVLPHARARVRLGLCYVISGDPSAGLSPGKLFFFLLNPWIGSGTRIQGSGSPLYTVNKALEYSPSLSYVIRAQGANNGGPSRHCLLPSGPIDNPFGTQPTTQFLKISIARKWTHLS